MILFFIFLFCVLICAGVFHYSYAMAADKNYRGRYLLVTLPAGAEQDEAVRQLLQDYRRELRSLSLRLLIGGSLLSMILLWRAVSNYVTAFLLLSYVSFLTPMALYARLLYRYRQKLLQLKAERGWRGAVADEPLVYADLTISRLKNKKTPSDLLFALPVLGSVVIFLAFPQARQGNMLLFLLGLNLLLQGICFWAHYSTSHAPAKLYTTDSRVNLALNQEYRRWWSVAYLLLSFLQTGMMLAITLFYLRFLEEENRWRIEFVILFMVMAFLPVLVVFFTHRRIHRQEEELLGQTSLSQVVDEDGYYEFCGIYGFCYSNPQNPALMVEKPLGIGSTLNIGNAKGRRIFTWMKVMLVVFLGGISLLVGFEDFIPPVMQVSSAQVRVARTLYPIELTVNQIESIQLIESPFPDGGLYKNFGSATGRYLRGSFLQKGSPVQLYLFQNSSPYLQFQLKTADYRQLYFNYQNPEGTRVLWQKLKANLPEELFTKKADSEKNNNTKSDTQIAKEPAQEVQTENLIGNPASPLNPEKNESASEWAAKRKAVVETELDYSIPAGQGNLHAVLNLPAEKKEPVPALLFIGGSGPTTKEGIANIYLDTAVQLLEDGIACVRYDKRGIARSATVVDAAKDEDKMVLEDLVGDAVALLQKMKADRRFSKVYVMGHSEGALVATLALQKTAADGLICVSGAGRNIAEITLEQITANPNNPAELVEKSRRIVAELRAGRTVSDVPLLLNSLFRPSVQPYLMSWMRYNPAQEIAKLQDIPILIVQGGNDMQVQVLDAENLHRAAPESRLEILPQMTHMLKDSEVLRTEIYRNADAARKYLAVYQDDSIRIAPEFIKAVESFIDK